MSEIIVRKAVEADISSLAKIEKESFSDPWKHFSLVAQLACYAGIFLAAEDENGKILGCIIGTRDGESAFIDNIAVAVSARKQGVGAALMEAFFSELPESVYHVALEVRESNTAAQKLYSRFGFKKAGIRKDLYSSPRENGIVMTLDLQQQKKFSEWKIQR